jgi:hypothetical protein
MFWLMCESSRDGFILEFNLLTAGENLRIKHTMISPLQTGYNENGGESQSRLHELVTSKGDLLLLLPLDTEILLLIPC